MNVIFFNAQNPQIKYLLFAIIFSCAFFLRIYKLESYPSQIHVDELSNIYDGYSLSETGADRSGMQLPVIIRGYGESDYRPPLYVWLSSISIKILGYSVFAGRLPSVIFGMLSLILVFFVGRKIGGELFGYLSLFLTALSPWHITYSRLALESAVLPSFFIVLTIYLFLSVKDSQFKLTKVGILGFCVGFATNDYQSTKLIFFVISALILAYFIKNATHKRSVALTFILFTTIGAAPQLFAMFFMPEHFFSRASNTMIPFSLTFSYFSQFAKNFYENLSPQFLFLNTGQYNNLTISRLLSIEMSFFYFGILMFYGQLKAKGKINPLYPYILILLSILPSALTYDNPHALRASGNIIIFPMIVASGILGVYNVVKGSILKNFILCAIVSLILINFALAFRRYIGNAEMSSVGQQNLLVEIGKKVNHYQNSFNTIYIQDIGNQPYMYVINYCKIHPSVFQKMEKENIGVDWDHFRRIDKFFFLDSTSAVNKLSEKGNKSLGIFDSKISGYSLIDSVEVHGEKLFFYTN